MTWTVSQKNYWHGVYCPRCGRDEQLLSCGSCPPPERQFRCLSCDHYFGRADLTAPKPTERTDDGD